MQISPGSTPSDLPAWIQAVGSVIAILIAVYIPYRQRQAEDRQRRAGQKHLATFITGYIDHSIKAQIAELDNFIGQFKASFAPCSAISADHWTRLADTSLSLAHAQTVELERFKALPIGDWPSFEAASRYFALCADNRDTLRMISDNWALPRTLSLVEGLESNVAYLRSSMSRASDGVKDALREAGLLP